MLTEYYRDPKKTACVICDEQGAINRIGLTAKIDDVFQLRWICEPCLCKKLGIA